MHRTKLEHFRNLISLAAVDGKIAEIERVTLSKIAFERGVSLERLNFMLDRGNEYTCLIPQNLEEREEQLEEMIDLALADGEFATAEMELIFSVGKKLGFSKKEIDAIIEKNT